MSLPSHSGLYRTTCLYAYSDIPKSFEIFMEIINILEYSDHLMYTLYSIPAMRKAKLYIYKIRLKIFYKNGKNVGMAQKGQKQEGM